MSKSIQAELGRELRRIRESARISLRNMGGWSHSHLSNVENGRDPASPELLAHYAKRTGASTDHLQGMLNAEPRFGKQEAARQRRTHYTKAEAPQLDIGSFIGRHGRWIYRFTSQGNQLEVLTELTFEATRNNLSEYQWGQYASGSIEPDLHILDGGSLLRYVGKGASGFTRLVIRLDRTLMKGEHWTLRIARYYPPSEVAMDPFCMLIPNAPYDHLEMYLQFSFGHPPSEVEAFESTSSTFPIATGGVEKLNEVAPFTYYNELRSVQRHAAYGVRWEWPPKS